jgi:uncharacterized protein YndB with AHSA1/START domain
MDAAVKDISLTLVRTIKASPEKVFQAWLDPAQLKRWFVPANGFHMAEAECDPRIGGHYRLKMIDRDGDAHVMYGAYREIVENRKIVFTWSGKDRFEDVTLVTIELRAVKAGTELTLTHERFPNQLLCDQHNGGWSGCLDTLARVLEAD